MEPGRPMRLFLALAAAAAVAGHAAAPLRAQAAGGSGSRHRVAVEARARLTGFSSPDEVTVRLTGPAHLAVFEVRPGLGSLLRYPRSRSQPTAFGAGVHRIGLEAGPGQLDDGFRRLPGYHELPALGRLSPLHLGFLGRPFLLVVASRDPLWLAGRYLGRVVQPRDVFPSLTLLVDEVLRDVVPHPRSASWAFDLVPGRRLLHPFPYGGAPGPPGDAPGRVPPALLPGIRDGDATADSARGRDPDAGSPRPRPGAPRP